MKRFLSIPACALMALGALTSCQKEEQTALQLADELTAELQKVTDYTSAEAVAPRVAAINKRYQNAGVRVFSVGGNALVGSDADAYAEAVCRLAREMGRVRSGKPMTDVESGDVDDIRLVRAVGVASGATVDTPAAEQLKQGQKVIFNDNDANANTPPALPEYYGSKALSDALAYVADPAEFGPTRMDADEDIPAIPEAVEIEEADDSAGLSVTPAEEPAAEEEPAADTDDSAEETSDDSGDVEVDTTDDSGDTAEETTAEETTEEETTDDSGDDGEISIDMGDDSGDTAAETTQEETTDDSGDDASAEEETTDDSGDDSGDIEVDATDDSAEDDGMLDIEI